jgi:hypothetical protein
MNGEQVPSPRVEMYRSIRGIIGGEVKNTGGDDPARVRSLFVESESGPLSARGLRGIPAVLVQRAFFVIAGERRVDAQLE